MSAALGRLCAVYAAHVGVERSPEALDREAARRLSAWPAWAGALARLAAAGLFWLAPLAVLGRLRRLDGLSGAELEELLARLQRARWPAVRGAFLAVKSIVLPVCYGPGAAP